MRKNEKKFSEKVKKILPTEKLRFSMLLTLLGVSGIIAEHIMEESISTDSVENLPTIVRYALAVIAGNMIAFIKDDNSKLIDLSKSDFIKENDMSNETKERIYRKMKLVIETLYMQLKLDEEKK